MQRILLKSKIYRAKVTKRELYYEGSITLDKELVKAANLVAGEQVQVLNLNNGARFETYVIVGNKIGEVILNGPAARLGEVGDEIIILGYSIVDEAELKNFKPKIVYLDNNNRIIKRINSKT